MRLTILAVVAALAVSCGGAPNIASPSPAPIVAPLLCVSGQSNATGLLTALQAITNAQGWTEGAQPIRFWHAEARGWSMTAATLTPTCGSFVWFQGETDDVGGETPDLGQFGPTAVGVYRSELPDLLARVRLRTSSTLRVIVVQIAPRFSRIRPEQAAACAADLACVFLSTDDLNFADGIHLDAAGYATLAERIRKL